MDGCRCSAKRVVTRRTLRPGVRGWRQCGLRSGPKGRAGRTSRFRRCARITSCTGHVSLFFYDAHYMMRLFLPSLFLRCFTLFTTGHARTTVTPTAGQSARPQASQMRPHETASWLWSGTLRLQWPVESVSDHYVMRNIMQVV